MSISGTSYISFSRRDDGVTEASSLRVYWTGDQFVEGRGEFDPIPCFGEVIEASGPASDHLMVGMRVFFERPAFVENLRHANWDLARAVAETLGRSFEVHGWIEPPGLPDADAA
ncbi:MAG: hypothetical protein CMJ31_14265 [Phycisphaerae bacterium]|nr:hypothetical protein [Phycisphaerae bacterium]